MSRTIRAAALQLRAHDRRHFEREYPSILQDVRAAARDHDLLVIGEGTIPAYVLGYEAVDDELLERAHASLCEIARVERCTIVAGTALRHEGALYNAALVIDADGRIAGSAEKIFLWHFDRQWFARGSALAPIETAAGRLGVLICADGRMPAIARTLVDRGAEILAMPTAWVTSGRDPQALENIQADLLARVRAFENGVPFIAANKCGTELGMVAYCGKSQIVDADGAVLALASQTMPETLSAIVSLEPPRSHREPVQSPPARTTAGAPCRIAISCDAPPNDRAERLRVLEAQQLLCAQGDDDFAAFDAALGAVRASAEQCFDPGFLVPFRRAGYRAVVIDASAPHPWLERIARTRAAELRLYAIVFDRSAERAYAIDPDGAVIAGTFGDYRIASFPFDPARTAQTLVAPGTDVAAGLELIDTLAAAAR